MAQIYEVDLNGQFHQHTFVEAALESGISHGLMHIYSIMKDKINKYPKIKLQAPEAKKKERKEEDHFKDEQSFTCFWSLIKRQLK